VEGDLLAVITECDTLITAKERDVTKLKRLELAREEVVS
jgi:hypothetical protein